MSLYEPQEQRQDAVQQWMQDGYSMLWMEEEEYRGESEVEPDSDHEETDDHVPDHGGWFGNNLQHFHTDLDSNETGTVRRRAKTIVTPKMAMESFRLSFLTDDQDVNFDIILGELSELETQLTTAQTELSHTLGGSSVRGLQCSHHDGKAEAGGDTIQAELDALAAEITQGLSYRKTNGHLHVPTLSEQNCDAGETDSAYSDNASLPSSESFTSMATVSSSAETTSSSSGETSSMNSAMSNVTVFNEEEQMARMKAEKIRIALEKIREAKIRKLFVRAFAKDGSSKSILVDEKMTVGQVCSMLADKHHGRLNHSMTVVEHMPELFMERILEDHDSLVENMVMWTRDSKNKVLFEERIEKYNLFLQPEKYLLPGSCAQKGIELGSSQKERLIQEFFSPAGISVPEVEGALYLKSDGKKAWKKYFFVLRASGLYYNPKGKVSKAPKDLVCLVQFEFVEVYRGLGWKKKYHSPSDFCFALKHPQIQKKTSKYIRYFCAETETALDQWVMGIRIAKLGKQLLHNYERVHHDISTWDLRQATPANESTYTSSGTDLGEHYQSLNQQSLQDSRLSVPDPSPQHTIVTVHNPSLIRNSIIIGANCHNPNEVSCIEVTPVPQRKCSEGGVEVSSGHKTPTKRVSFSTTPCIISDSCEQLYPPKHRDSIVSHSTDSSEDSNSSGEGRITMANTLRGKLRAKLPVTTETTRLLTEMNHLSFDSGSPVGDSGTCDETSSLSSASSTSSRHAFSRSERRRASMTDRRGSDTSSSRTPHSRTNGCIGAPSSTLPSMARQHSHEGSPVPQSPLLKHSGLQQWVEGTQTEAMTRAQEVALDGYIDHYMYAGGMSYYHQQQQYQQFQQQQQQLQYQHQHSVQQYQQQQQQQQYQQHHVQQYQQQQQQQQHHQQQMHVHGTDSQLYNIISLHNTGPANQAFHSESIYDHINMIDRDHVDVVPPPPQFQEQTQIPPPPSLLAPSLLQQQQYLKASPPPTAPKPAPASAPPVSYRPNQPPPPPPLHMLPKSVPAPPEVVAHSSLDQAEMNRCGTSQPKPEPPPLQMPSQQAAVQSNKIGPPVLPKSSSPLSPVSCQSPQKVACGTPPVCPLSPVLSAAATSQTRGGSTHASHNLSSGSNPETMQAHVPALPASSSSPSHRVSHIKHPSTGSLMVGIGASPSEKGPTPSDSGYIEGDGSSCSGSPSNLPYLAELSRRTHLSGRGTSPPEINADPASPQNAANHRRSASAGSSAIAKGGAKQETAKKAPPPPKRSESTRLSTDVSKQVLRDTPPASPVSKTPAENSGQNQPLLHAPIYENYEGMMDINDLPPPPPELLAGLPEHPENSVSNTAAINSSGATQPGTSKKQRLPPPPPKRSKDTQLSCQ